MSVATSGRGLLEITAPIRLWLAEPPVMTGLLTVWCRHTSASLLVQENADPDVRRDLESFFRRIVPDGDFHAYIHDAEGPDDMPAHIRAALTQTQLSIPVQAGKPVSAPGRASIFTSTARAAPARAGAALAGRGGGGQPMRPHTPGTARTRDGGRDLSVACLESNPGW